MVVDRDAEAGFEVVEIALQPLADGLPLLRAGHQLAVDARSRERSRVMSARVQPSRSVVQKCREPEDALGQIRAQPSAPGAARTSRSRAYCSEAQRGHAANHTDVIVPPPSHDEVAPIDGGISPDGRGVLHECTAGPAARRSGERHRHRGLYRDVHTTTTATSSASSKKPTTRSKRYTTACASVRRRCASRTRRSTSISSSVRSTTSPVGSTCR